MNYIKKIIKKEIKAALYNRKVFIVTILSQLVILALIVRSKGLFETSGFHSISFSINLTLVAFICQIMPQSYFYDKETGIENLLILSRRFSIVTTVRIVLYSIISMLQLILIVCVFKFFYKINVYIDYMELVFNLLNCINLALLEMMIVLITKDKNLSSYLSFVVVIFFILFISYLYSFLIKTYSSILMICIELIMTITISLIVKIITKFNYKIYR